MSGRVRTALELLLVTLLGSPLVTPLLRWQQVPCTHDGHLHYHRVVAMMHAWRDGLYFSRWLPDLAFGYGYPFFLYREPLPLYLTLWPHLLGLPLPAAINLFYVASILAAGCFTYLWVRDIFGSRAAIVSAVAYMAAPYQLIDALVRGNQVESMALALFPLILWAGRRFVVDGGARWFLTATLALAALALSHNISLLLFTPALVLYLLFAGWLAQREWKAIVWRAALVLALGLGMTAFYTAPAVLEIDEVTLTLSTSNRNNDFRFNFSSLEEMLSPVTPEDPALINPPLPIRLGWAPTVLAIVGLLSLAWNRRRKQRLHIGFMASGALIYAFFALPISQPLWEALPLIEFVQFPWRFVGRAALPIAVLAGAPFASGVEFGVSLGNNREYGEHRGEEGGELSRTALNWTVLFVAAIAVLLIEALPVLYPALCAEEPYPTIANVHAYERDSGMVGIDPVGSYFPVTVEERPQRSPLLDDYAAGRQPQRFDTDALPEGATVQDVSYEPLEVRVELQSPSDFQARTLTFDFPGWTATVDGERVPITPEDPTGLITFPVPAGQHEVAVRWRATPLRAAIGVVSLLAAIGTLATGFLLWRRQGLRPEARDAEPVSLTRHWRRQMLVLTLLGFMFLATKLLVVDRLPTPLRRSAQPPVERQADVAAGGLRLQGYNLSRERVVAGEHFDVDLAWRVESSPNLPLQSNVWLRDAQGTVWSDRETFRPRIYEEPPPVQQWQAGQWAWDSREVHVLPGTPPGQYEIVLTLFNRDDLQPLTLVRAGNAVGPTAVIGEIEILRPDDAPQFAPQHALSQAVDGLRLLGYSQDRSAGAPGDPLLLTLFWEKPQGSEGQANTVALSLRDDDGAVRETWQIAPVRQDYAPGEWQPGERLRGQHLMRLPAALESGNYQFWLQDVPLGRVQIEAPQRTFEEPAYERAVDEAFGQQVRLVGYSVSPAPAAGEPLDVTLVWQALQEMETSYRVFVHLIDEGGAILAQSDAEPAQWARPTTGWVRDEYVIDTHVLSLPAQLPEGELRLRVGLFDAETGQRLQVAGGAEFVLLQP